MKIDMKCRISWYWYSLPQSLPQAVEIPTFTFMVYICYAVTVEETEEPVVGQNTLGIKVVTYEDVRGYIGRVRFSRTINEWVFDNLNVYLEHPLIGNFYFYLFKRKIFIIYLFFYQKPLFYNKIQKVVNYLNIPVRYYQSVAPVPESQRLFFILKQRLSNNTKATLHTCVHKPLLSPLSLNNGNKWK